MPWVPTKTWELLMSPLCSGGHSKHAYPIVVTAPLTHPNHTFYDTIFTSYLSPSLSRIHANLPLLFPRETTTPYSIFISTSRSLINNHRPCTLSMEKHPLASPSHLSPFSQTTFGLEASPFLPFLNKALSIYRHFSRHLLLSSLQLHLSLSLQLIP